MEPKNKITKSLKQLYNDAPATAVGYYYSIKEKMKEIEGEEWCNNHPEIIAKLAEVATKDYHTMLLCKTLQEASEDLGGSLFAIFNKL